MDDDEYTGPSPVLAGLGAMLDLAEQVKQAMPEDEVCLIEVTDAMNLVLRRFCGVLRVAADVHEGTHFNTAQSCKTAAGAVDAASHVLIFALEHDVDADEAELGDPQ